MQSAEWHRARPPLPPGARHQQAIERGAAFCFYPAGRTILGHNVEEELTGANKLLARSAFAHLRYMALLHKTRGQPANQSEQMEQLHAFVRYARPMLKTSHSQIFQDIWVRFMLGDKREGWFAEFGADDGLLHSNTYVLEKDLGWTGVLAEPNPPRFEALKENRSVVLTDRCVAGETGRTETFVSNGQLSGLERIRPEQQARQDGREAQPRFQVRTVTLADLLDEVGAPEVIDYISIDTEGAEFEILKDFPFDRRGFRLMTIEHGFGPHREAMRDLLAGHGYHRWLPDFTAFDDWYVHESVTPPTTQAAIPKAKEKAPRKEVRKVAPKAAKAVFFAHDGRVDVPIGRALKWADPDTLAFDVEPVLSPQTSIAFVPMVHHWRLSRRHCAELGVPSVFDRCDMAALAGSDALIVFDGTAEGSRFEAHIFEDFLTELPAGIALDRLVFLQTNQSFAADMAAWCDAQRLANPRHLIWNLYCHNLLRRAHGRTQQHRPVLPPEQLANSVLCLNHRARRFRARALSELLTAEADLPALLSWRAFSTDQLAGLPTDVADRLQVENVIDPVAPGTPDFILEVAEGLFRKSFVSLVTESEMTGGAVRRITEKSLKPAIGRHPFLVAGNPGTLAHLRELGLRTFGDVIDESYDEIVDPEARLTAVLAEAKRLAQMGPAQRAGFIAACADTVAHNHAHVTGALLDHPQFNVADLSRRLTELAGARRTVTG